MMKLLNRYTLILTLGILCNFNLQAQDDNTKVSELGIRLGSTRSEALVVEAVLPVGNNRVSANITFIEEFTFAGLYNWTFDLPNNFLWHVGAGLTIDIGNIFSKVNVDAVVGAGIEHKFSRSPISLGLDWQPVIELSDGSRFSGDTFAFTLRYILR